MSFVVFIMKRFCMALIMTLAIPLAGRGQYKEQSVAHPGVISGTVRFDGPAPAPVTYTPSKDTQVCGTGVHTGDEMLVNSGGGIRNVVVSLTGVTGGIGFERASVPMLDQKGCRFQPHIVLIPKGGTLDIMNNDNILHNIRTTSRKNAPFNKAHPRTVRKIRHTFTAAPEKIKVQCDAHSWMSAWIVVQDHPYYAVTDEKGKFTLESVPPGTYTVEFWHERLGARSVTATVSPDGRITADCVYTTP
jgi:plastocyanin